MKEQRIIKLMELYASGAADNKDLEELAALLDFEDENALVSYISEKWQAEAPQYQESYPRRIQKQAELITATDRTHGIHAPGHKSVISIRWRRVASWLPYAAALLTGLGITWHFNRPQGSHMGTTPVAAVTSQPVESVAKKAILTLSNGDTILLDDAAIGSVANTAGTQIIKLNEGALEYVKGKDTAASSGLNTISTPVGTQYQIALSDGTRVWLNAASSISFPPVFNDKFRKVTITGEAYMQVARDKARPFSVQAKGLNIEVIGTSFNLNSYDNEGQIKTTLIEGAVAITSATLSKGISLKPGEQGIAHNKVIEMSDADIEKVTAWKNGFFNFYQSDLASVMRELSRWYGIQVRYEGDIRARKFWGTIRRDLSLTDLLEGLERSDIHFKIEGSTVTVTP